MTVPTAPTEDYGSNPTALRRTFALILLLCGALIVLSWTMVAEQVIFERDEAVATALRDNRNRVIAFEQYVVRTLQEAEAITKDLAGEFRQVGGSAARPVRIVDPVVVDGSFATVAIFDVEGKLIASSAQRQPVGASVSGGPAFETIKRLENDRLYVGRPRRSPVSGKSIIPLARRLKNADGSFAGIVAVEVEPGQFTDFYQEAQVRPTDLMSLIGLDGITRARRDGGRSSFGEDLRGKLVMRMQFSNPNVSYVGPSGIDGIIRYFSHRRLKNYPLFATVGVARDEVLRAPRARSRKYYAVASVITVGTVAFAWFSIAGLRRRQRVTRDVASANERLREAQRIGKIGDWDFDVATQKISWSEQLFSMYERDPWLGPPPLTIAFAHVADGGEGSARRAIERAIETGEPQSYELCVRQPSGRITYHQTIAIPTKDESGKVVRLHGTDQDITARKMLENLQAEVAHSSRVDAMNTMAATLAHELNQPLTAATNYLAGSKRLLARAGSAALPMEGLDNVDRQIKLAADIIRRIREMVSGAGEGQAEVELRGIVEDALALVSMANDYPQIRLEQRLSPQVRYITADKVQIQQVLINLIRNACDASVGGEDPLVTVSSETWQDGFVRICVADRGRGIPTAAGDLFHPFTTSKKEGLGLGLSISRTIVEGHGGKIWIETSNERGTRICFTVPGERPESTALL
ncbi:MAG: ATP-binding protein [Pseudomonadota bacterium]|nr:ATP-binding protein [Pseudomonadota bacterium]